MSSTSIFLDSCFKVPCLRIIEYKFIFIHWNPVPQSNNAMLNHLMKNLKAHHAGFYKQIYRQLYKQTATLTIPINTSVLQTMVQLPPILKHKLVDYWKPWDIGCFNKKTIIQRTPNIHGPCRIHFSRFAGLIWTSCMSVIFSYSQRQYLYFILCIYIYSLSGFSPFSTQNQLAQKQ